MRLSQHDDRATGGATLDGLSELSAGVRVSIGAGMRGAATVLRGGPRVLVGGWSGIPRRQRLAYSALLAVFGAAGVADLTYDNPLAAPAGGAVIVRVSIIFCLVAAGIYAQTSETQTAMGGLLVAAGLFSAFWLLNGSDEPLAFSVGMLCAGLAPTMFAYVVLAHPSGRLRSPIERNLIVGVGGMLLLSWSIRVLTAGQPPLRTPLLRCAPNCPDNLFYLGSAAGEVGAMLKLVIGACWISLTVGAALLLFRRIRAAAAPMRRSLVPVALAVGGQAVLLVGYLVAEAVSWSGAGTIGAAYVEGTVVIALAILLGLGLERLFMGRALASVVNRLAQQRDADPEVIIGNALSDPSLTIAYPRPGGGRYVDSAGHPVAMPPPEDRAVTWVGNASRPVAAVIYDGELRDQERFLEAVGAAALMRLENARLEAELRASTADLTASRIRLVETAHAERRRIERDLHDGVQQQLVALRIKLESAAQMLGDDVERGQRMVAAIGRQMDDALEQLRSLARGIYPSVLHEQGVVEALKSIGRRSSVPVSVRGVGVGRYPEDVEVAVYFACVEALQNVAKHGGNGAAAAISLRQEKQTLCFQVRDSGVGFNLAAGDGGSGLVNMRDRIDAVGGTLSVTSKRGGGTTVAGRVPTDLRRADRPRP